MKRTTRIGAAAAAAVALLSFSALSGSIASGQDAHPDADAPAPAPDTRATVTENLEDTYVPVTPCRIVDGREALGVIPAGGNRSYEVRGTTGFVPQGGKSGGCGIPTYATAVTFTVTIVSPAGGGFLRAWPQGKSEPNATLMNFVGGQSETTTAPLTLGATSEAKDIRFKAYSSDAMLVIDVQGYYAPQIHASVALDGVLTSSTARVTAATRTGTGIYQLTIDRDVSSCAATANPDGSGNFIASAVALSNKINVYTYTASTGAASNIRFTLHVAC